MVESTPTSHTIAPAASASACNAVRICTHTPPRCRRRNSPVHRLPRSVPGRDVPPGGTRAGPPPDAVDGLAFRPFRRAARLFPRGSSGANHDHCASVRSARPGRCRYRVRSRPRPPGTARRPAGILDEGGRRPRGASLASSRNRWSSRGFGTCTPRNAGSTHLIATAHGDERGAGTAVAPRPSMAVSPVCSLRVRGRTQPASGGRTIRRLPRSRVPSARNRYPSGSFGRCPRAPRRATIRPDTHCAGRVPWWRRHRSSSPFGMDPSRGLHERGPHR